MTLIMIYLIKCISHHKSFLQLSSCIFQLISSNLYFSDQLLILLSFLDPHLYQCTMLKDTRKYQADLAVILFLFQVHRGISAGTAVPPIQHFLLLIIEDAFTWMS